MSVGGHVGCDVHNKDDGQVGGQVTHVLARGQAMTVGKSSTAPLHKGKASAPDKTHAPGFGPM